MLKSCRLLVALAVMGLVSAPAQAPALEKLEIKCASKLSTGAGKLAASVAKLQAKCLSKEIAGKLTGPCPDAKTQASIDKAFAKLIKVGAKSCGSKCSVSGLPCISKRTCPPLPNAAEHESCNDGGTTKKFDAASLGFPGAFCPGIIGRSLQDGTDIATCVGTLADRVGDSIIVGTYGEVTSVTGISAEAASCLAQLGKSVGKMVSSVNKAVAKCRDAIHKGKNTETELGGCFSSDQKTLDTIVKTSDKLDKVLAKKCTDEDIVELDLCGAGIGGTTTAAAAGICLKAVALDLVDAGDTAVVDRVLETQSLLEAVSSPPAVCGDGAANQLPNHFQLVGEECDGADDAACPGACFPPGDLFECSCGTVKRARFLAEGPTADLDIGWTGVSHNGSVSNDSGFMAVVANCDCDDMDGHECVGNSTDPICTRDGTTMATCSWDLFGGTRCDDFGDGDNSDEDEDCTICDEFSADAGTICAESGDCEPQCFDDVTDAIVGTCTRQSDCPEGSRCKGGCDQTQTCAVIPLGASLPTSSGGTPTCLTTQYAIDAFGTTNIVTAESDTFTRQFTLVHGSQSFSRPCPVCGGFCEGGTADGEPCHGSCSISDDPCRFDDDCPGAETCTTASPLDCPQGGFCQLELLCKGGPNDGETCRPQGATELFGTTSGDCPPDPSANFSGIGLQIGFFPSTTELNTKTSDFPCTAQGFQNYDCPCEDPEVPFGEPRPGNRTRPNACNSGCNAGAELGQGCGDGDGSDGTFTKCLGGDNAGENCDEDSDCQSLACSANPQHCSGDPGFERLLCSTNGDCGAGTCGDACPTGRCVPLCLATVADQEEGECAAGPVSFHCSGTLDRFRTCLPDFAIADCQATCEVSGDPCSSLLQCDPGEACTGPCEAATTCEAGLDGILGNTDDNPAAGVCVGEPRACFLDPITGEGGDIFNGGGTPGDSPTVTIYCVTATTSAAINGSTGLPGPGRLRQRGQTITNGFETLP
ncbi:MAG: hypothetical protein ACI8TX_000900 [Hyphomicrobiaceae bacterium]|jgi:hypothetical protein